MTSDSLFSCEDSYDAHRVAQLMADNNVSALAVVDSQGRLEGFLTDRDLMTRVLAEGRSENALVREIMTENTFSVREESDLDEVEELMKRHHLRRLPVLDRNNRVLGMILLTDLLHFRLREESRGELTGILETIDSSLVSL
ncbi:MAG: CBS domain-containing protein [Planctomycetota bacterium]|jgi:signal-transduction protein with cAMP-binding, CBS, and nucleotidyltransferase domain